MKRRRKLLARMRGKRGPGNGMLAGSSSLMEAEESGSATAHVD